MAEPVLLGATLQPVDQNLFPAFDSLEEAVAYVYSKVPVESRNEMYALLMTYHNTILKELSK